VYFEAARLCIGPTVY